MLEELLEHVSDGICGLDAAGRVVLANHAAAYLLGLEKEEMFGVGLSELACRNCSTGEDILSAQNPFDWLEPGLSILNVEGTLWNKDGIPVLVELIARPIRLAAIPHLCMLVSIKDVSERLATRELLLDAFRHLSEANLRLEETSMQLLQTEKLAAIGQLAAGMAHEINNPIGFVLSNLSSLDRYVHTLIDIVDRTTQENQSSGNIDSEQFSRLKRESDYDFLRDDVLAALNESRDGVLRVKKIVQDLRTFSPDETMPNSIGWFDVYGSVKSVIDILGDAYRNVQVYSCVDMPQFYGRSSEIKQVWMALLINAHWAVEDGGDSWVEINHDAQNISVDFIDSGCGISSDVISRVFEPFFTTRPVGSGRGLGLTIASGVVNGHGGKILVESTVGIGSRFSVVLPIVIQEPTHGAD